MGRQTHAHGLTTAIPLLQESKKQEHNVVDEKLWYKYKTITTATDASGAVIHSITGDTITYDIDTLKNIDPDRNKQGNDMQDFWTLTKRSQMATATATTMVTIMATMVTITERAKAEWVWQQ